MTILQLIALLSINGYLLLVIFTHLKGRRVAKYLQKKYPNKWEDLGKPQPKLAGPRQTWSLFLSNEEYHSINDRRLTEMCERQRRLERATHTIAISFFMILGGIALWDVFVNQYQFISVLSAFSILGAWLLPIVAKTVLPSLTSIHNLIFIILNRMEYLRLAILLALLVYKRRP